MAKIIPAIIGQNFTEVANKIRLVEAAASWVHLDIMDGTFTAAASWPAAAADQAPADLESLDGQIKIECHLMVRAPEEILSAWVKAVDRVLIHLETTDRLAEIAATLANLPVELGIALSLETPLSKIDPFLQRVCVVHLMSIAKIGEHGQPFATPVLEKIKHLRAARPDVTIQVDGGINLQTAPLAAAAGADNLVVGSAIWQTPDPISALQTFQSLLPKS